MAKSRIITVQDVSVTVSIEEFEDYICITDIAEAKSDQSRAADVIRNWLRNRSTLEYLSEWVEQTGAVGLFVKRGKYGGTYAHGYFKCCTL